MSSPLIAEDKIEEGSSKAIFTLPWRFSVHHCAFPFACIKGPIVRMVKRYPVAGSAGGDGAPAGVCGGTYQPVRSVVYTRVVTSRALNVIHLLRVTRTDLNDLIGLPGLTRPTSGGAADTTGLVV